MSTTQRSIMRGTAGAAAALAMLLGAAACTGGDEEPTAAGTTSEGTEATAPGATGADDPTEPAAAHSPFDQTELEVASQRFVELLQVLDDEDWRTACGMVLDPTTGSAPEGERLQECADDVEPVFAEHSVPLRPGAFDEVDVSMVEVQDNGDDTVSLSVLGKDLGTPMAPGDDGRWYLVIPF